MLPKGTDSRVLFIRFIGCWRRSTGIGVEMLLLGDQVSNSNSRRRVMLSLRHARSQIENRIWMASHRRNDSSDLLSSSLSEQQHPKSI